MSQGLWTAVSEKRPVDPRATVLARLAHDTTDVARQAAIAGIDAAAQTVAEDKQKDYDKLNLQVLGCIRLRLTALIQTKTANLTWARNLWANLKKDYATPGMSLVFSKFQGVMGTRVPSDSHPREDRKSVV